MLCGPWRCCQIGCLEFIWDFDRYLAPQGFAARCPAVAKAQLIVPFGVQTLAFWRQIGPT
jgi:hypothetical protein